MAGASAASTAATLQRLLEAEGAVIHAALQARALPSMGGGVGMVLTRVVPPGTTLAEFPFRSMITARKARFNLAMAEVALEMRGDAAAESVLSPIPFTSRVWSGQEFESRVRSHTVRSAIEAKVEQLEDALDSTETIVCYILLMAALHGRWRADGASPAVSPTAGDDEEAPQARTTAASATLRYTHENRWMRTWIHALPVQYDNLLELAPQQCGPHTGAAGAPSSAAGSVPAFSTSPSSTHAPPLPLGQCYTTTESWLRSYVALERFRTPAMREQRAIQHRYEKCCAALRSLRCMPRGEEAHDPATAPRQAEEDEADAPQRTAASAGASPPVARCSLGQFVWAFNTLMSRGFFFPEETWALMPYVDYFNYALDSNGTMYPQEDDPNDQQSLSSVSLARAGVTAPEETPLRKAVRRTGLRTARVGKDVVPSANYSTYKFELIRPLRSDGEQVMLHYGAYSDLELLMWYGFTLRPFLLPTGEAVQPAAPQALCPTTPAAAALGLLPLSVAVSDTSGALLHTAQTLRQLLPQVVCAASRAAYYQQHIRRAGGGASPGAGGSESAAAVPARDADDVEDDFEVWQRALQRVYQLRLSPLADAEGNYPPAEPGKMWIDVLFDAFTQTTPLPEEPPVGVEEALHSAAVGVDRWMRRWVAQRWSQFAPTAFPRVAKNCALTVMGLTPVMHDAIASSFWTTATSAAMGRAEQLQLVRGIAWAELYTNALADTGREGGHQPACEAPPVSGAAAAYAQIASVDLWVLLRFLSLECPESLLEEYLSLHIEAV